MKVVYRGFRLEAKREMCNADYPLVYYSAYRISGGLGIIDSFTETDDPLPIVIEALKKHVNDYLDGLKCDRCGRSKSVKSTVLGKLCQYCRASDGRHMNSIRRLGGVPNIDGKPITRYYK
jgi:hypothetical protein